MTKRPRVRARSQAAAGPDATPRVLRNAQDLLELGVVEERPERIDLFPLGTQVVANDAVNGAQDKGKEAVLPRQRRLHLVGPDKPPQGLDGGLIETTIGRGKVLPYERLRPADGVLDEKIGLHDANLSCSHRARPAERRSWPRGCIHKNGFDGSKVPEPGSGQAVDESTARLNCSKRTNFIKGNEDRRNNYRATELSCGGTTHSEDPMRTLAFALATAAALGFAAPGAADPAGRLQLAQDTGMQSGSGSGTTKQGGASSRESGQTQMRGGSEGGRSSVRSESQGRTSVRSESRGSRTTVGGRSETRVGVSGRSQNDVIVHRKRVRHEVAVSDEPSTTVIKKKRKRAHFVASEPESRTTVIKRRQGVAIRGESGTRTSIRERSSNQMSVRGSASSRQTTTGSSSRTTTRQSGSSNGQSRQTTGSGQSGQTSGGKSNRQGGGQSAPQSGSQ
jgi:hypothetical protein